MFEWPSVTTEKINGVPQGSILGPIFFIVYIKDIIAIPRTPAIILYADDTSCFFSGMHFDNIHVEANAWLHKLSLWLNINYI